MGDSHYGCSVDKSANPLRNVCSTLLNLGYEELVLESEWGQNRYLQGEPNKGPVNVQVR